MNKPVVLYLSYDGLTDPLGQSQVLPYLCGLSDKYNIHIVSFEKPTAYKAGKKTIETICEHNALFWHPLVYHKSPPVFSTLFDLMTMWYVAKHLHKRYKFSIVHCRSYITSLIGLRLKKKYEIKFMFDMRGFWADERIEGGIWKMSNPVFRLIYKFFKRKEREFLINSDHIVTLTQTARSFIFNNYPMSRVTIIPCCADADFFNPDNYSLISRDELRSRLGIASGDYVLGYVGSLGTWYLYEEMVNFFDQLKRDVPQAKMLFLTPDKHKVVERPDFIVLTVLRKDVPAYINLFDASICFIKPTFSKSGSSATKIAEVLSMGIPVVVNSGWGDISTIPAFSNAGVIVENVDSGSLQEAVKSLIDLRVSSMEIRTASVGYFSLRSGINHYREIYHSLIA